MFNHSGVCPQVTKWILFTQGAYFSAARNQYRKVPHIAHGYTPKVVRIRSEKEDIVTCLDGECVVSSDVTIRLADKRLNFFGPVGCSCNRTAL